MAAAQENRGARLAARGIKSLTPEQGNSMLTRLVGEDRTQVGVVLLDVRQWIEFYPVAASSRMLSRLCLEQHADSARLKGDKELLLRLSSADPAAREALLQQVLVAQVSQVLRIPEGRLAVDLPLQSAGLDSLMGLELRNRIEATLGITMPATLLWTYPTVAALSRHLSSEIGGIAPAAPVESEPNGSAASVLEEMSDDELLLHIAAKFEELT